LKLKLLQLFLFDPHVATAADGSKRAVQGGAKLLDATRPIDGPKKNIDSAPTQTRALRHPAGQFPSPSPFFPISATPTRIPDSAAASMTAP
jgi:hypothetical protein